MSASCLSVCDAYLFGGDLLMINSSLTTSYTLRLVTCGPTFIGSGNRVNKKEYRYSSDKGTVFFYDLDRLMDCIIKNDLIEEFEDGDPRLAVAFHELQDGEYDNQQVDLYGGIVRWLSLKYAMMTDGENGGVFPLDASNNPHDPINTKEIRYADVLLMYAEACVETGDTQTAKELLERVRNRARGGDPDVLPEFPGYEIRIWNGTGYDAPRQLVDNADDLRAAIRHERRVELAMEGHRWFDLNRWGITAEVINAQNQTEEAQTLYAGQIQSFRKGVNEIFPIPAEERRLTGIDQNEGY